MNFATPFLFLRPSWMARCHVVEVSSPTLYHAKGLLAATWPGVRRATRPPSHLRQDTCGDLVENLNWGSRSSRTIPGLRFWRFDTCLNRVLLTLFTRVNDQPENACENKYSHNEWENNACIHDFTPYLRLNVQDAVNLFRWTDAPYTNSLVCRTNR